MIIHTVLLQPKKETTREQLQNAFERVHSLKELIPGIVSVTLGKNLNTSNNQGYTYGFIMQFVDLEHLKAYAPHPAHQVVARELVSLCDSILDFDIEQL